MGLVPKTKVVTVVTAGTAVPVLSAGDLMDNVVDVTIQASSNLIYVGDASVKASTGVGHKLDSAKGEFINFGMATHGGSAFDLAKLYLDASVNGSTAVVTYWRRV